MTFDFLFCRPVTPKAFSLLLQSLAPPVELEPVLNDLSLRAMDSPSHAGSTSLGQCHCDVYIDHICLSMCVCVCSLIFLATPSFSVLCEKSTRAWEIKPRDINVWMHEQFEQEFDITFGKDRLAGLSLHSVVCYKERAFFTMVCLSYN